MIDIMRRDLCIILLGCTALLGCSNNDNSSVKYTNSIDSLMYHGGNRYDVASYLLNHPDYADEKKDKNLSPYHESLLSADGRLRVYSIYEVDGCYDHFKTLLHFQSEDYSGQPQMDVKADLENIEYLIHKIGVRKTPDKTYYLFCFGFHHAHQSEIYNFAMYAYSIDHEYCKLQPEYIFKTKGGRMLHSIDVIWDDSDRYDGSNLWGIDIDSENNTSDVYIQLIDENPGEPHDSAFVYKWDGSCFNYAGLQPATFPPYKDL